MAGTVLRKKTFYGLDVTDADIFTVIRLLVVEPSDSRKNVLRKGVERVKSVTIGLAGPGYCTLSKLTREAPTVLRLLSNWIKQEESLIDFCFTSVQINVEVWCARHRDSGNLGPSVIKTVGDYRGGLLKVWPRDRMLCTVGELSDSQAVRLNPRRWSEFDGRKAHETEAFSGSRVSFVFYTTSTWETAAKEDLDLLKSLGVRLPVRSGNVRV